jgi:hypothetical protein
MKERDERCNVKLIEYTPRTKDIWTGRLSALMTNDEAQMTNQLLNDQMTNENESWRIHLPFGLRV